MPNLTWSPNPEIHVQAGEIVPWEGVLVPSQNYSNYVFMGLYIKDISDRLDKANENLLSQSTAIDNHWWVKALIGTFLVSGGMVLDHNLNH